MSRVARLNACDLRLAEALVSFTVGAGECVALLGAEADALSRLVDTLAGHLPSTDGRILVDDRDVSMIPPSQRRIGVLSKRDPLFAHLSVRENVAFPLRTRRVGAAERTYRVQQVMALLDLERHADCRPASLDPGGLVRAALARVLVCDPAIVLLDDSLASIDPEGRRDMHQQIRRLARARGLGVLLATRDRDEALMVGDRIGILSGSSLCQIGQAAELFDHPADESVAVGFGEANSLSGRVEWVEDDVAHVRLSAGASMDAMASNDLAEGMLCVVCVRPERIAVAFVSGDAGDFGGESLAGVLSDMVHLGDHLRLRFRLTGGGDLLVRRPASQPTAGLHADRPAALAWQAAHAVAFAMKG